MVKYSAKILAGKEKATTTMALYVLSGSRNSFHTDLLAHCTCLHLNVRDWLLTGSTFVL